MAACALRPETPSQARCASDAERDAEGGAFPCFNFEKCGRLSEVEHRGRSLCRPCAEKLAGTPYPLREASRRPLYTRSEENELAWGLGVRLPAWLHFDGAKPPTRGDRRLRGALRIGMANEK